MLNTLFKFFAKPANLELGNTTVSIERHIGRLERLFQTKDRTPEMEQEIKQRQEQVRSMGYVVPTSAKNCVVMKEDE